MRLTNIKLAGFKSFVDPTNVKLTTNMVAVIGPNGCGKSNIIDAVRWVMGESSAKTLRGESMADVIFNGSTARKPVGQASIELIFDNSDGTLGGEYGAFTEIAIKRQVTRDGQSQYFLNGSKCRRRDITDIFLGTGLGPRSYAIIEQGMISRLIESKPEELRVFVEEAAGISKYKERRKETETRIRHTRENLERLTDLREELDRQLQRLKRQAAAAVKYKEYKTEEKTIKAQTHALQWQDLRDESAGRREQIAEHEIGLEAAIAEQRGIDATMEQQRSLHSEKTDAFSVVQTEFYSQGAEIARAEETISHHEKRAQQLVDDLAETESNAAESAQHLRDDREKLTQWQSEVAELDPRRLQLIEAERAASSVLREVESSMQDWQQRWDAFNEAAIEPQKNAEVQRSRIVQIDQALTGLGARLERLEGELTELDTVALKAQQVQLTQHLSEGEQRQHALQAQLLRCTDTVSQCRGEQKLAAEKIDSARSDLQQQRGKLASLEALQAAAQRAGDDHGEWLKVQRLEAAPRLLDSLDVDAGWEKAVETVLGDSLQAVSVDSLDALSGALADIGDGGVHLFEAGSATPVAISRHGLDPLASKIQSGERNLLQTVFACDDLPTALAARQSLSAGESIVTRDGIWLGAAWLRVLPSDSAAGVIARRQLIDSLREQVIVSEREVQRLVAAGDAAEQRVLAAEAEKDQLLADSSSADQVLAQMRADASAVQVEIEQVEARLVRARDEIDHAEHNQVEQRDARAEAARELEAAERHIDTITGQRETLLLERDQVRDQLVAVRDSANQQREALQAIVVRWESLRAQIDSVQSAIQRLEGQVEQLEQRKLSLREAHTENDAPLRALRDKLEQQLAAQLAVETRLGDARGELEAVDQSIRQLEQQRNGAERKTETLRAALEKLRIDSQASEVRLKTIEEQLQEDGFQLADVLSAMPEEAVLTVWQENLSALARRIERLGAINLAAIEEYDTESERKIYLDAQNDELESALSTLESAIQKIDRETRNLFKETFDTLNASLQELFPRVFGGGTAYLEMTGDDLLDTGIAIMARPPGKRNSTIHLLSGGEKALTAIALVFSIFQMNPAPFCMLDEVDAPLDDANTARYAKMVKEMSEKVQFIFITHNKITMEMADHLMGVTMHEPGCSRMVSVDIDEAVQLAAS